MDAQDCAIDGHRVVWAEDLYGDYDIFMYDLSECSTYCITYKAPGDQRNPDISGDLIVWQDNRWGDWDIYGWNLSDPYEFVVCWQTRDEVEPVVSGNMVVWAEEHASTGYDVYRKDLSDDMNPKVVVCQEVGNQWHPQIDGETIVWEDFRNGDGDIYGYDLTSQTEFHVYVGSQDQVRPDVSGSWVVWANNDTQNGRWGIYGTDLAEFPGGTIYTMADEPGSDQTYPAISGDKVVWHDNRTGNWDIYGGDLTAHSTFIIQATVSDERMPAVSDNFVVWHSGYSSLCASVFGMALGVLPWKQASPVDFEYYYPEDTAITDQYEGVVFSSPGAGLPSLIARSDATSSSQFALKGASTGEFGPSKLRMDFAEPQEKVTFALGNGADFYTIFAYDPDGDLIITRLRDIVGDEVYYNVEVRSHKKNIKSIEVHAKHNYMLAIDDVRFHLPEISYPECWDYPTQCHGDCDNTGDVKGSDFLALTNSWYKVYPDAHYNPCADFDRNGEVKASDFLILKTNWYKTVAPDCLPGGTWPP
ncbi:MAG: hypothetical protein ACYTEQ_07685 [Planctomycetota bacterium]